MSLPVWATAEDPRARLRKGGYPTKAEATAALQRLLVPTPARRSSRLTTAKWLARWLEGADQRLRPTTVRGYRKHIDQYLTPLLGKMLLRELTYDHIQQAFVQIMRKRRPTGDAISAATLRRIQATLRAALNAAVNAGLIDHNPARDLDLPNERRPQAEVWTDSLVAHWRRTGERPPVAVWTPIQTAQFLHLIGDHRLYTLYHLYILRGLRRGEALGLLWSDVDFERGTLTIERQLQKRVGGVIEVCPTKTRAGQRQIALDRGTLRVLRAHRRLQETERTAAGERWTDTGYIFTGKLGAPLAPDHVGHVFQGLVRTHNVPPIRLHDLRHCAASLELSAGVDLKVLQHQVGHASILTTADTYASVLPQTAQEGAEATARLVQEATREYSRSLRHRSTAQTRAADIRKAQQRRAA